MHFNSILTIQHFVICFLYSVHFWFRYLPAIVFFFFFSFFLSLFRPFVLFTVGIKTLLFWEAIAWKCGFSIWFEWQLHKNVAFFLHYCHLFQAVIYICTCCANSAKPTIGSNWEHTISNGFSYQHLEMCSIFEIEHMSSGCMIRWIFFPISLSHRLFLFFLWKHKTNTTAVTATYHHHYHYHHLTSRSDKI